MLLLGAAAQEPLASKSYHMMVAGVHSDRASSWCEVNPLALSD